LSDTFKKGKIENFPNIFGLKLAPLTYGLLSLIPLILVIISLIQKFTLFKIAVLNPKPIWRSFRKVRRTRCTVCSLRSTC
ncbi:hypothetical protein JT05_12975, partial [Desulfosporosinus sp. Tol-M]